MDPIKPKQNLFVKFQAPEMSTKPEKQKKVATTAPAGMEPGTFTKPPVDTPKPAPTPSPTGPAPAPKPGPDVTTQALRETGGGQPPITPAPAPKPGPDVITQSFGPDGKGEAGGGQPPITTLPPIDIPSKPRKVSVLKVGPINYPPKELLKRYKVVAERLLKQQYPNITPRDLKAATARLAQELTRRHHPQSQDAKPFLFEVPGYRPKLKIAMKANLTKFAGASEPIPEF